MDPEPIFTSDHHFGHSNVIEFCKRPFGDLHAMHETLIDNWNSVVKNDDKTVWVLGDIFFGTKPEAAAIMRRLRGRKYLIKGNHDAWSDGAYIKLGFEMVLREAVIKTGGHKLRLSHYPYWPPNEARYERIDLRYPERRPHDDGGNLLCGHVHDRWKSKIEPGGLGHMINVGVDAWDLKPVRLMQLIRYLRRPSIQE